MKTISAKLLKAISALLFALATIGCDVGGSIRESAKEAGVKFDIVSSEWQTLFANAVKNSSADLKNIYTDFAKTHSVAFMKFALESASDEIDKGIIEKELQASGFVKEVAAILERYGELAKIDKQGFQPFFTDIVREISRIKVEIPPHVTNVPESVICWTPKDGKLKTIPEQLDISGVGLFSGKTDQIVQHTIQVVAKDDSKQVSPSRLIFDKVLSSDLRTGKRVKLDLAKLNLSESDSVINIWMKGMRNPVSIKLDQRKGIMKTRDVPFVTTHGLKEFTIYPQVRAGRDFDNNPNEDDFWGDLWLSCRTELQVHDGIPYVRILFLARRENDCRMIMSERVNLDNGHLTPLAGFDPVKLKDSQWMKMQPQDQTLNLENFLIDGWKFHRTVMSLGFHDEKVNVLLKSREGPFPWPPGPNNLVSMYKLYGDQNGPDVPPRGNYTRAEVTLNPVSVKFVKEFPPEK